MRQLCRRIHLSPIPRLDSDQQESTADFQSLDSSPYDPLAIPGEKSKKNTRKIGVKQKITQHFREQGFEVEDIPKAIVVHELLGILMLALTWSACFHFPPSQSALLKPHMDKVQSLMPPAVTRFVAGNRILSGKMGASYLESSCLRKLIRPITLPGKMYVTLLAVRKMAAGRRGLGHPDSLAVAEGRSLLRDVRHVLASAGEELARFRSSSPNLDPSSLTYKFNFII